MVQKAADQDNALACVNLGLLFEKEEKYEDAIYWFIKASDLGYADAQYIVGTYFEKGETVEQDYEIAFNLYYQAAKQGQIAALSTLGRHYYSGTILVQDFKKAVEFLKEAAKKDDIESMRLLGQCYLNGQGVEENSEQFAYWTKKLLIKVMQLRKLS